MAIRVSLMFSVEASLVNEGRLLEKRRIEMLPYQYFGLYSYIGKLSKRIDFFVINV